MIEPISKADLHKRFRDELERVAPPGSVFVFEIERKDDEKDGCNWYPLASMASWQGDVMENLAAFRAVREHLSARYHLEPEPSPHRAATPASALST